MSVETLARSYPAMFVAALAVMPAGSAVAQTKLTPRSFLPEQYHREVFVDVGALHRMEIVTAVRRSVFNWLVADAFEAWLTVPVDRVESAREVTRITTSPEQEWPGRVSIRIVQGKAIDAATYAPKRALLAFFDSIEATTVAGRKAFHLLHDGEVERHVMVVPQTGLAVAGDRALIEAVLAGEHRPGLPSAELLALAATPDCVVRLAEVRAGRTGAAWRRELPLPESYAASTDAIAGYAVQLCAHDDQLELTLRVRFASDDEAVVRFVDQARAQVADLVQHRRWSAMRRAWKTIVIERDKIDVTARLPLGTPEQAMTLVIQLAMIVEAMRMADQTAGKR